MCGICGLAAPDAPGARGVIDAQLACLDHRGPDARGCFSGRSGFVGQNRLAIIDLVTGDPPISNEDGTVAAVLNGEIYNFAELRDDLRRRGHDFRSRGDTEVIVHLAEELPPAELAERLDGMFALAIWDDRRARLVLARDRVGKKPLYYWCGNGRLVFGSEIKAVLAHPDVPRRLDESAIPAYLTFGYVPTPRTFYDGVRSVPPGHVLTFEPGEEPLLERYWAPPVVGVDGTSRLDLSLEDAAREVRGRLEKAVRRRLVSDVPLGAFLSGGVDSTAIVGIMTRDLDRPVETFTMGFDDEEGYDERPFARLAAREHGTNHHEFVVKPDAVELMERLVYHHDQPFGDASAIPTFLLSELTRRHVTVALCGDGGDELFAGYERFSAAVAMRQLQRLPAPVRQGLRVGAERTPGVQRARLVRRTARFLAAGERPMPDYYRAWISFLPDDVVADLLEAPSSWGVDDYRRVWDGSAGAPFLDR